MLNTPSPAAQVAITHNIFPARSLGATLICGLATTGECFYALDPKLDVPLKFFLSSLSHVLGQHSVKK